MTNPIAVSQQRRRILARQICAWAQSTSLSAKDAEDFGCDAIDAFEAEIRADEREASAGVAGLIGDQLAEDAKSRLDQEEKVLRIMQADGAWAARDAIRNQKEHDHE